MSAAQFAYASSEQPQGHASHRDLEGSQMLNSRGAYNRRIRGSNPRNILSNTDVAIKCKTALKAAYGESKTTAKDVAEDAGQSPRAAENWLAGENPMGLTAFLNAYLNNKEFKAWARKILLQEDDCDPEFEAELSRFMQVAAAKMGAGQ